MSIAVMPPSLRMPSLTRASVPGPAAPTQWSASPLIRIMWGPVLVKFWSALFETAIWGGRGAAAGRGPPARPRPPGPAAAPAAAPAAGAAPPAAGGAPAAAGGAPAGGAAAARPLDA